MLAVSAFWGDHEISRGEAVAPQPGTIGRMTSDVADPSWIPAGDWAGRLVADQSLTFGDRVVPVVIGAVIALVGAVFVQLWLVPRVDTRKRREQRWEEDVLALGQLLTLDQPRIVGDLRSELHWLVLLVHPPDDVDTTTERWAALKAEHRERLRAARGEFDSLATRVDWLADRVTSLAPHAKPLQHLASQSRGYYLRHLEVGMLEWRPNLNDRPPLTDDEINTAAAALSNITREIVTDLKGLATAPPPRNPPTRRARTLAAKVGARLRRKRPE